MRTHHTDRRLLLVPILGLAVAAGLTACSSSSSSSTTTPPSTSAPAATSSAPVGTTAPASTMAPSPSASPKSTAMTSAQSIAEIKKNWVTFFNGKTPTATREALLENGTESVYVSLLKTQAVNPQAAQAGSSVQTVTLTSATKANVVYSILLSGVPVLTKQKGVAVLQGGTWKVATSSFCSLALLESGGKAVAGC